MNLKQHTMKKLLSKHCEIISDVNKTVNMNLDKIRSARLSEPEKFLLEIFDGLEKYIHGGYPNKIYYMYNCILLFEYDIKNRTLFYEMDVIHLYFKRNFKYTCDDTFNLVRSMFEQRLKLMVNVIDTVYLVKSQHIELKLE